MDRIRGVRIAHADLAGTQRGELGPGPMADRQIVRRQILEKRRDRFAGCFREDEGDEERSSLRRAIA